MTDHRVDAKNLTVEWIDRGREPQCAPDPRFPSGVDIDLTHGESKTCAIALPYPAKRCGYFLVRCGECGLQGLITTAGRADDPRSLKIACKLRTGN
jgi:hypothetical protein